MSRDRLIEHDRFKRTMSDILDEASMDVYGATQRSVQYGARRASARWREHVKELWKPGLRTYTKHGQEFEVGRYYRSIRSHVVKDDGMAVYGEAGAPNMAGLPHLLEFGHAKVGGGRTEAFEHVAPAADEAVEDFKKYLMKQLGGLGRGKRT